MPHRTHFRSDGPRRFVLESGGGQVLLEYKSEPLGGHWMVTVAGETRADCADLLSAQTAALRVAPR